jgi:hypothetical protein
MFPKESISLLDFDIYSRRISFFYKNKEKIGSSLGIILTISYAVISITLFLFYFIRTIRKDEVTPSDSTIYPKTIPSIDINNNMFYLAFGLEHPTKFIRFIDEKIYYPEVLYVQRNKESGQFVKKEETILNIERCDINKFGGEYQNLFQEEEIYNSYCLKDFNLTLKGGFKFDKMSFIKINIYPCVNSTKNNNHCKPQKEIDFYLTSGYFSVLAKDIGLDPFNYSFPTLPLVQDIYTVIDKSFRTEFIIYFGITEIDTDTGLFTTNIKKDTYLKYINNYHSIFHVEDDDYLSGKEILTAQIRLQDNIYFQKRSYTKMSQVFSTTGGYMQLISTIFALISLLTKKISLEKKLLNSLFNFNIKNKKIILCVEYQKRLDYNTTLNKGRDSCFIPYEAKKSIISNMRNRRRNSIFFLNKTDTISPDLKKGISKDNQILKNVKKNYRNSKFNEDISKIFKNLSKEKELNTNVNDQSINRSKVEMLNKEENFNGNQISEFVDKNKDKTIPNKLSNFNLIKDFKIIDKGNCATIHFNLFDYYCLRRFSKKRTEIELFKFGINFYKSQMDIINFFNIMFLTQIMLTQKSEKKHNILSQKIELSIN